MAKSIIIPANIRKRATWKAPDGRGGSFTPNRESPKLAYKQHPYLTPNSWDSEADVWAARIFVGFSVGQRPKYNIDDLIRIVKRVRRAQTGNPDASFVYQKGVYTHKEGPLKGQSVTEDGAQAVLLNLDPDVSTRQFYEDVIELAQIIREELEQEEVIVDVQKNGITVRTIGIDAEAFDAQEEDKVLDRIEIA